MYSLGSNAHIVFSVFSDKPMFWALYRSAVTIRTVKSPKTIGSGEVVTFSMCNNRGNVRTRIIFLVLYIELTKD